jgi:hypothetical protein
MHKIIKFFAFFAFSLDFLGVIGYNYTNTLALKGIPHEKYEPKHVRK